MWNQVKLSGFADEIDENLETQIKVLKKLGINYIEMRGVNGKNLIDYSVNEVKEIKKKLDEEGISLSSVGSPIGKIRITQDFAPHMESYKHTVEIAHVMQVPFIRMFSFFMPEGESYEQYRQKVMDQLGQFVDYAKSNGVILLHENEKDIYGDTTLRCEELMKTFYGEHFKGVFDFANFVQCKQDTIKAYETLKPYIAYVHIKDAIWESADVVPAGMGDGHIKEILQRLKADGYEGFLSLEPHLSSFKGFSELEQGAKQKKELNGEEAFTLAYDSLMKIIDNM